MYPAYMIMLDTRSQFSQQQEFQGGWQMLGQRLSRIVFRRIPSSFVRIKNIRPITILAGSQNHRSNLGMIPKFSLASRRNYGATAAAFVPKSYFFRLFWTFVTGTIGFVYYKISEASDWLSEQVNIIGLALGSSIAGILEPSSIIEDIFDGWKTLSLLLPSKKTPNPPSDPRQSLTPPMVSNNESFPSSGGAEDDNGGALDDFKHFIKRMIEIRNILRAAHLDEKFNLPSVVVIGSQSSGKSSVLESIVGHEFLPKGQNMVTRRPLELTLVNDPQGTADYGVFTDDGNPIYDFGKIQRILTERNLSVPEADWISEEPIQLTIYSKHIPDLTLVDLPGYIQINNRLQPAILREKIAGLCEKYIADPNNKNLILAVCPADVDLANAEALKASRRVDPSGERTLGVITKLDLVDPEYGAQLLQNEDYPLSLGYVGVVCKPGVAKPQQRLLSFMKDDDNQDDEAIRSAVYEQRYFAKNKEAFSDMIGRVGINSLRNKLTMALEESLARSMSGILKDVQEELAEVKYQLKVEFSDRNMTPEGYVNTLLTTFKGSLEGLTKAFTRAHVKEQIQRVLEGHLIQVIERSYAEEPAGDEERLQRSMAVLTRSGIGKVASGQIVEALLKGLEMNLAEGPLSQHPRLRERLIKELEHKLRLHSLVATEMVENALKPYKHEIEYSPSDWSNARKQVLALLKEECSKISQQLDSIQQEVGGKRLRKVIQFLAESPSSTLHNKVLLERAETAVALNHRLKILKRHMDHLEKTAECKQADLGSFFDRFLPWAPRPNYEDGQLVISASPCHKLCPQVYLYMINERLLRTSALFVHHELIHEFMASLPHDLMAINTLARDTENEVTKDLVRGTIDREAALPFVSENVQVAKHVELLERRRALERVRDRLLYLKHRKDEASFPASPNTFY